MPLVVDPAIPHIIPQTIMMMQGRSGQVLLSQMARPEVEV